MADEPPTIGEQVTLVTGPTEDRSSGRLLIGEVSSVDDEVRTTSGVLDGLVEIDREVLPDHDGCGVADPEGRLVGLRLGGHARRRRSTRPCAAARGNRGGSLHPVSRRTRSRSS